MSLSNNISFGLRAIGRSDEDGNFKINKLLSIDATMK